MLSGVVAVGDCAPAARVLSAATSAGAQLRALVARGFDTHTAAPYCDGQSTVEALATLIASDAAALEEETANPRLRTPRSSNRAKASVGGGSGSSACVIS